MSRAALDPRPAGGGIEITGSSGTRRQIISKPKGANTMSDFTFTASTVTCKGKTFPAGYSITPSGAVIAFVETAPGTDRIRLRFDPSHIDHAAALAAAEAARKKSAPVPAAEPAPQVPAAEPAPPVPAAEPAAEPTVTPSPKQARGPVPEKTFIGDSIQGKGWKILFDGDAARTRVIFDGKPSKAARALVEKAGFYYSAAMDSWNKKLTFKAYRAAQALSGELRALCA